MTREEFWDYINGPEIVRQVYIVHIRQKYTESGKWEYTNEVLEPDSEGGFIWRNDWHEGQKYVEILGCIAVSDVDVPDFEEEIYNMPAEKEDNRPWETEQCDLSKKVKEYSNE